MTTVGIERVGVAHPPHRVSQEAAACALAAEAGGLRRVAALARASRISERAVAVPPGVLWGLGGIEERNDVYRRVAPTLANSVARNVLCGVDAGSIGMLVTSSCTGYALPGWGVDVAEAVGLPTATVRLPITEAGCAGGVLGLARAADYLAARPGASALVIALELCSLSFQVKAAPRDDGYVTSAMLFGDGAGAGLLRAGETAGFAVVDSSSTLIPGSRHVLGYDLTGQGFRPVLSRELAEILPPAASAAARQLCERHGLATADVGAWLLHPGGPRILEGIERSLGASRAQTRWAWDSMRDHGNTSSAAIFDVLGRYLGEERPPEWAVVAAFGPGVSIELLLARRCS